VLDAILRQLAHKEKMTRGRTPPRPYTLAYRNRRQDEAGVFILGRDPLVRPTSDLRSAETSLQKKTNCLDHQSSFFLGSMGPLKSIIKNAATEQQEFEIPSKILSQPISRKFLE
jgi:hypothetical protein